MGVIFTCCPDCGGPIQNRDAASGMPQLCRCAACKTVWVKGDTKRFKFDTDELAKELKGRFEMVTKNSEEERTRQLLEADDDDPRWVRQ